MKLKPSSTGFRWFWPLILVCAMIRVGLSLLLLKDSHYFFTLSADDVARYRLALLWVDRSAFFPDPTWPPLPFWLGGLLIRFFSTGPATLCGLSIGASILSLPLLGILCLGLIPPTGVGNKQSTFFPTAIALAVFVFYPNWIWLGTSMLAESLYSFLILLAFILFILAVERKTIRWAFLSLFVAVLASMTRLEGIALTGLIYILLVWRMRRHPSKIAWFSLIVLGGVFVAFFPIAWMMGHSGGSGTLSYFATLKEGFTSKYGYNPFRTPIHLLRIYLSVFPLILFLILVGFFGTWHERKKSSMHDLILYQVTLLGLYIAAQCLASALGMMPTHTFWRLTVPVYVILLPYLGVAFALLGRFLPTRTLIIPSLLCVFYLFPSFTQPPLFVTPDLYQSGIDIKEEKEKRSDEGTILIEAVGWEWLPLTVLANGPHFNGILFDHDPNNPQATNLNPPVFNRPIESLRDYLTTHNVHIVAVKSLEAKQKMMELGWKTERSSRYAIFIPTSPSESTDH